MKLIILWITAFFMTQAPPNRPHYVPDAKETEAETVARYESIATDIADVVYDKAETPLFKGSTGRVKTAAVIESIMLHESGLRRDIDLGTGKLAKGDHGQSWCMMQVRLGNAKSNGKTQTRIVLDPDGMFHYVYDGETGLGGEDLVRDRKSCIRTGLHIIRHSFMMCSKYPILFLLDEYTSGLCSTGQVASERRLGLAMRWYAAHRPTFTDNDVKMLTPTPAKTSNGGVEALFTGAFN